MAVDNHNEDEYVLLEEEQTRTQQRCAALEAALLDLRRVREVTAAAPPPRPTPPSTPLLLPSLILAACVLAVFGAFYEPPTSYAWEAPQHVALPGELARLHARGMTLVSCRVDRAALICAEMPDDCGVAQMSIGGDVIPANRALNQEVEKGGLARDALTSYRVTQIGKLRAAVERCEKEEDDAGLRAIVDESRTRRLARAGGGLR